MSDILGDITGASLHARSACRVAYTINNMQPVACTIIGDQPLFYMDHVTDHDDEILLADADMDILEGELKLLKTQIDSFDKFSETFAQDPDKRFQEFQDDKNFITAQNSADTKTEIEALLEILCKSRLGEFYTGFAAQHGVTLVYSSQIAEADYDRRSGKILINSHLDMADQVLLAARELRRHWQHRQGALIHPLAFHPDNAILINRAQVADLSVSMVRLAWELQLSGVKAPWERIENSSMSDLGRALAREAFLDFRTLNNGEASAAVFESWFLSERCRSEDKKLIQQMLADYQGYVFDLETAAQGITPALISALGTMPYGKNYLAGHATTIMGDPVFTDVRDRSNANFLWFIKFERSFRETEQELQLEKNQAVDGVRQPTFQKQTKGSSDANAQQSPGSEKIIRLFPESGDETEQSGDKKAKGSAILKPKTVGKRKKNKTSAEIVYLRRWSGE